VTFIVKSERILEVMDILSNSNERVHYNNEPEIARRLREAVAKGAILENQVRHHESIKEMLGKHRVFE
jgi:hypothetical protein